MGKRHVTFRLSDQSLEVIKQHQQRHGFVERTEALEDILKKFWKTENKIRSKFRRFLGGDPQVKPLEVFINGKENNQLSAK